MTVAIQTHEKLFTSAEAAEYLGLAEDTVRQYIRRKLITPLKKRVGRAYLVTEAECERFLRDRRPRGNPGFSA